MASIAFIIVIVVIVGISFWGFIQKWTWQRIVKNIIIISVILTPLALLDNYRIFIIAIIVVVIFEMKNRSHR